MKIFYVPNIPKYGMTFKVLSIDFCAGAYNAHILLRNSSNTSLA